MIQTMTQHSQLHRANMLDWLRHCVEIGEAFPTDGAIAERFQYESTETARTLLADLADRGEISIRGSGPAREIVIAPVKPPRAAAERPISRTVRRPERPKRARSMISDEEGTARIMAIIRSGLPPEAPAPAPRLRMVGSSTEPAPAPVAASEPPPVAAAEPDQQASRKRDQGKQLAIRPSADALARLELVASAEGKPVGRKAREMLEAAILTGDAVEMARKPVVPVSVLIASIAAGKGLHEFVADLIERGLVAWQQEQGESVG